MEGEDFTSVPGGTTVPNGGNGALRQVDDYAVTLDMAKQLCMMSHTELGKKVRLTEKQKERRKQVLQNALISHRASSRSKKTGIN
ncbi:antA/AntB antirepressor family protein [Limosilactobacillus reuteri]|uniref:antA/AntB antirepressor family protein n=1 Tax=Limosilactobacillus reuteri TaxID=1598 RepID=UPI002AAAF388|nr:antA/AntB antirepressor family protein [Limosilactobacillus reuteri]WPU45480.1 antA/AntB antirepressor family protein [Limosilactobacillus reuteri]